MSSKNLSDVGKTDKFKRQQVRQKTGLSRFGGEFQSWHEIPPRNLTQSMSLRGRDIFLCFSPMILPQLKLHIKMPFSTICQNLNIGGTLLLLHLQLSRPKFCLMKPGKTSGYDGVQTENLLYATILLMQYLSLLFQACISQQYIPGALSEGLVTRVLKKGRALKVCKSYRPINICSRIGRLIENRIF